MMKPDSNKLPRLITRLGIASTITCAFGCANGLTHIDREVAALLAETTDTLGRDAMTPSLAFQPADMPDVSRSDQAAAEELSTINPAADELSFYSVSENDDVLQRLESYQEQSEEAVTLGLTGALELAMSNSREYRFAEEEYILTALQLLIERHLWGPRFFNDVTATVSGDADDHLYDTSFDIVNEFRVTHRLPYGGEVAASALARATEDLHLNVVGEEVRSAEVLLTADIPLLRGAGVVAREDRIQAERNLIYSARDFEEFRRDFLFDITRDFLNLVVQQQSVINAERRVEQLQELESRERALYDAGRTPRFQAALAEQSTVSALDELYFRQESFRLAVDQFKVRLNIPIDQPVTIIPSSFELPIPHTSLDEAVQLAMNYRLDLQTQYDTVDDARRQLSNTRNNLLPDLDFNGEFLIPNDPGLNNIELEPGESSFSAGLNLSLPLDRKIERLGVRQSQILLERAVREYERLRDAIAVNVRNAVRDIDRARYTLQIQERSIEIGEQRVASIEAAPDRATARDASDAANELLRAQDARDRAKRDLEVAILRYLLETGQLRVESTGTIRLPSMNPPRR